MAKKQDSNIPNCVRFEKFRRQGGGLIQGNFLENRALSCSTPSSFMFRAVFATFSQLRKHDKRRFCGRVKLTETEALDRALSIVVSEADIDKTLRKAGGDGPPAKVFPLEFSREVSSTRFYRWSGIMGVASLSAGKHGRIQRSAGTKRK